MAGNNMGRQRRREEERSTQRALAEANVDGRWKRPDKSEWDDPECQVTVVYQNSRSRIVTAVAYVKWDLAHYSIKHEIRPPRSDWKEIYRSDSSHDSVHRHENLPYSNDYKTLRELRSLEDLADAYEEEHSYVSETCSARESKWGADND